MPRPIRERTSWVTRLDVLAQIACLRLRSAGWTRRAALAPHSRIGWVGAQFLPRGTEFVKNKK